MVPKIRDWLFIAVIGAIFAALVLINIGGEKPRNVPPDERHRPLIDLLANGKHREEVEKKCASCHNAGAHPLPKNHPPKEQCLICHKAKG